MPRRRRALSGSHGHSPRSSHRATSPSTSSRPGLSPPTCSTPCPRSAARRWPRPCRSAGSARPTKWRESSASPRRAPPPSEPVRSCPSTAVWRWESDGLDCRPDETRETPRRNSVSDQDLFERFKRRAVEVLSVEDAQVKLEAKFADDLDADSLDLVEFVMALEEEFDINVEEQELEGVDTIGQAFELVKSKI